MNDERSPLPRWGNESRDRKAAAILQTMVHWGGERITQGVWIDVGCGSGGICASLAQSVSKVVGVDPEPWPSWNDVAAAHANLSFRVACFDGDNVPVADATADVVVCNQVYEHVTYQRRLLANIQRVLRPGGYCYFAGPNLLWPVEPHVFWPFVHWLPRRFAQRTMTILGSRRAAELDACSRSYWTLVSWMQDAGFHIHSALAQRLAVEFELRGWPTGAASAIKRLPQVLVKLMTPMSPGFVFILRKPS